MRKKAILILSFCVLTSVIYLSPYGTKANIINSDIHSDVTLTADDYIESGNEKSANGHYPAAILDYNRAIERDQTSVTAYTLRGIAKANIEKYFDAIKDFDKTIEMDPNSAKGYYNRAVTHNMMKNKAEAKTNCEKARQLNASISCNLFER